MPAIGDHLSSALGQLAEEGLLAGVRGDGAVWAAALPDGVDAGDVHSRMIERGVIARAVGPSTVAFCPPYVITAEQLERTTAALRPALQAS